MIPTLTVHTMVVLVFTHQESGAKMALTVSTTHARRKASDSNSLSPEDARAYKEICPLLFPCCFSGLSEPFSSASARGRKEMPHARFMAMRKY